MSRTTYHLLTEAEPFSEFSGGAISRWAGNVRSASHFEVVYPGADATWNFAQDSIRVLPAMAGYKHLRRHLQRLPWVFHRRNHTPHLPAFLSCVRSGDIVWIHNRPEFAVAITPLIHRAGARVVLHLHNSHLVKGPERLMRQVRVDRLV